MIELLKILNEFDMIISVNNFQLIYIKIMQVYQLK